MRRVLVTFAATLALLGAACSDPGGETPVSGPYGITGDSRIDHRRVDPPLPDAGDPQDGEAGEPEASIDAGIDAYVPPDAADAAMDAPPPRDAGHDAPHDAPPPPPTWTQIFNDYVASGSLGNCGGCHGLTTASDGYTFLKNDGQIDGTKSAMVTKDSDFSWFGGFMPPGGPQSEPTAVKDMKAWVAAGALEN